MKFLGVFLLLCMLLAAAAAAPIAEDEEYGKFLSTTQA